MSQLPPDRLPHPGTAPQPPGYTPPPPGQRPAAQEPTASIGPGIAVVVWAGIALFGGIGATAYLVLGAVVTQSLDGVFDGLNGGFNWAVLLIALIGQLVGLIVSVIVMLFGIGARRRRMRRGGTAMALGIVASAIFLLIGVIQLPLVGLVFEALGL